MTRHALAAALLFMIPPATADAATRWRISGTILERLDPAAGTTAPRAGMQVKISARWSDSSLCPQVGLGPAQSCPWNDVNWSDDTSDAAGRFTSTSIAFLGPDARHARDLRIEVRHWSTNGWREVSVQSSSGPAGNPARHDVILDPIVVDFDAPPPVVLRPDDPAQDEEDGVETDSGAPSFGEADPCLGPSVAGRPDLAFGPLPGGAGSNVSPDGLVRVQLRQVGGQPHARRLRFSMTVRNEGSRDYSGSEPCEAIVRVFRDAGPGEYGTSSQGAVATSDEPLGPIADGFSRMHQMNVTLRGTGPDGLGLGWDEAYEFVRFEIMLDADGRVFEGDESNNRLGPYCYHAPSNTFVTGCEGVEAEQGSRAEPGPASKPARGSKVRPGDRGRKDRKGRKPAKRNGGR